MSFLRGYLTAIVVLGVLDGLWLGFVGREFYKTRLGPLLLDQPVWVAAILFYLVYAAGIVNFPARLAEGTLLWALLYGALFGLCAYATYDLSNLATLRGWPLSVTIIDLVWGALITAAATAAAVYAAR